MTAPSGAALGGWVAARRVYIAAVRVMEQQAIASSIWKRGVSMG
jgi:hypothetical protein